MQFLNIRNIVLAVVFIMLTWQFIVGDTLYDYIIYFSLLFLVLIKILSQKRIPMKGMIHYDLIPGIFIITWFYGVLVGLWYGNELTLIVRNFAGMTIYSIYYVLLYLKISKDRIFRIVYFAAFFDIFVGIGMSIIGYKELMAQYFIAGQFSLSRLFYSSSLYVVYVLIASVLALLSVAKGRFHCFPITKSRLVNFSLLLLGMLCIILSLSKGFILGLIFILFAIPMVIFIKDISLYRVNLKIMVYLLPIFLLGGMMLNIGLGDLIGNIFAHDEVSNISRYEQIEKLQNEYSFFGKGMGAKLESGFERDTLGYGYEVSFHNLIHKIGIFSIILFFFYFYTFYFAICNLYKRSDVVYGAASIGAMCFIFPSIGNPTLFSPTAVVLHSIALYWLRREPSLSVKAYA